MFDQSNQSSVAFMSDDGSARTTSLIIAEGTNTEHRAVLQLVRTYLHDFEEFGLVAFEMRPRELGSHGGGDIQYATLNEQQATLLLTYMRNSTIVRDFKKRLVKEFWQLAQQFPTSWPLGTLVPNFLDPVAVARAWADEYEARQS